jgi:apolipoprotein N-acyltransferase
MALPWGYLEYTQAGLWPMRWLAGWVSGSGLAALVVLHNTAWAEYLRPKAITSLSLPKKLPPWLLALAIPALLAGLNAVPPPQVQNPPWPIPIAIVQANLPIELIRSGQLNPGIIEPAYLQPIRKLSLPKGTLLVYPEEGVAPGWVSMNQPYQNPMMLRLALLAREKHIYIAVGISSKDAENRHYNSIALLSPDTPAVQYYHKRRLVPFGEVTPYGLGKALTDLLASMNVDYSTPYDAGQGGNLLRTGKARLGGLICFELIDTAPIIGGYASHQQPGLVPRKPVAGVSIPGHRATSRRRNPFTRGHFQQYGHFGHFIPTGQYPPTDPSESACPTQISNCFLQWRAVNWNVRMDSFRS